MPAWVDADDVQLLKLAQGGDSEAFGELYERYAKVIFRFLYAHSNDRLDAEDLTEEVFLRTWRSLATYSEKGVPFAAYLYHIARNVLIAHHRRTKRSATETELFEEGKGDELPDPSSSVSNNLEHQELRQVLVQLREDYREVLVLRFLSEMSPEETAHAMERSVGAVRVLQHRALAAMRKLLVQNQGD
jgi:RNA polymerase sigma-70 factor (ECF subfamily)